MANLIIIDEQDKILGIAEKEKCHGGEGILHRAFSVFIFNNEKQLLIQKRSKFKRLWPLYWSNSCCSHPKANEEKTLIESAKRRLMEELRISCNKLKYLYKFKYDAKYQDKGSENEICAVLIGKLTDFKEVMPNPEEVDDFKWINLNELIENIIKNPQNYTPWFKMEIEELVSVYQHEIDGLFN